jgi:hypothetical protein
MARDFPAFPLGSAQLVLQNEPACKTPVANIDLDDQVTPARYAGAEG